MKNIYLLLISIFICNLVFCQLSNFSAGAGLGFGVYGIKTNDKSAKKDTNITDITKLITLIRADFSITKRYVIGVKFEKNSYLTKIDSSKNASSISIGINGRFNVVNKEKNLLYFELIPAYSYFTYSKIINKKTDKIYSNGINFQVGFGWDHYFLNHFGMFINTYIANYNYYKVVNSNSNTILKVNNPPVNFTINFKGVNLFAGLLFRL